MLLEPLLLVFAFFLFFLLSIIYVRMGSTVDLTESKSTQVNVTSARDVSYLPHSMMAPVP
jgi:hypothetical protein